MPSGNAVPEAGLTLHRPRRLVFAGVGLAVLAIACGVVWVLAGGLDKIESEKVRGGGTHVVRVALVDAAIGFHVTPNVLLVDRSTHLVLDVVNRGNEVHDLAVPGGPRTERLVPGQSERLDVGVLANNVRLSCTISGHKDAGMSLQVRIIDKRAIGPAARWSAAAGR